MLTVYGIETIKTLQNVVYILQRVATAPTVYGIETSFQASLVEKHSQCCNNTYRLRYATQGARQQRSKATMKSAHRKYLSEVRVKLR